MLDRRVEVLFEADELSRLRRLADARHTSVGNVVREAVRRYVLLPDEAERCRLVAELVSGRYALDLPDWAELEEEIERAAVEDIEPPH
jgi:hypothetical protein